MEARDQRARDLDPVATLVERLHVSGFFFAPSGHHRGLDTAVDQLGRELLRSDVRPHATTRRLVRSRRRLGPHTDHFRADYIAWECRRAAPNGGATFVVDPAPAFAALGAGDLVALREALMIEHRIFVDDPEARPALHPPDRLYFTYWLAEELGAAQRAAARRLRDALERSPLCPPALCARSRPTLGAGLLIGRAV